MHSSSEELCLFSCGSSSSSSTLVFPLALCIFVCVLLWGKVKGVLVGVGVEVSKLVV